MYSAWPQRCLPFQTATYSRSQNCVSPNWPTWWIVFQPRTRWSVRSFAKVTSNALISRLLRTNIRLKRESRIFSATCGRGASQRWSDMSHRHHNKTYTIQFSLPDILLLNGLHLISSRSKDAQHGWLLLLPVPDRCLQTSRCLSVLFNLLKKSEMSKLV